MPNSRSQSPLPPPPEENTPGHRATALQNALTAALDATLKKCSYDNFAACFPTTANFQPDTLEGFWKDFTGKLAESCQAEFKDILDKRSVVPSLNSLDRLIADAKARKEIAEESAQNGETRIPVPPHMLPATDILNAHLSPFLVEQHTILSAGLKNIEDHNRSLLETINAQRAEMAALVSGLETVVRDLESSAVLVQDEKVQGLSGEAGSIEGVLKG